MSQHVSREPTSSPACGAEASLVVVERGASWDPSSFGSEALGTDTYAVVAQMADEPLADLGRRAARRVELLCRGQLSLRATALVLGPAASEPLQRDRLRLASELAKSLRGDGELVLLGSTRLEGRERHALFELFERLSAVVARPGLGLSLRIPVPAESPSGVWPKEAPLEVEEDDELGVA